MKLIKPKKLQKDDTIGLLSVSGDIRDISKINNAANYFNKLGYKVIISDTTYKKYRCYAGTDDERVNQLHEFFLNPKIDAIVCTRGGYGLLRIVNQIDYDLIAKNPKIICGYSDITALLLMIIKKSKMVCFHGAMANGDFGADKLSDFTVKSFFDTLSIPQKQTFYAEKSGLIYKKGVASGMLWGGNLATIVSMIGLDFIPNEKFILFVEDVNEPAYKIDRMFTQLFNCEKIRENISGLVIGKFTGNDRENDTNNVIKEYVEKLNIPAASGFLISHEEDKYTLPLGIQCNFNSCGKFIELLETAFVD